MSAVAVEPQAAPERPPAPLRRKRRKLTSYILPVFTGAMILYLTSPVLLMILYGFNDLKGERQTAKFTCCTLNWWKNWLAQTDLNQSLKVSISVAIPAAIIATILGALIGLVLGVSSAYFGGWFDLVLQRIFDILMAFPLIILALAVVSVFGTGVFNVVIAITIPLVPRCGRVVRASALAVRQIPYVDAARALGFGHARIVLCHMVPNVLAPFLILLSAFVGQAILAEASLSYLGLGVQEPVAAWGLMLQGSAEEYATTAPWIAIFPGLAIVLTVLGASLFGDALRDAIDPKLRDR